MRICQRLACRHTPWIAAYQTVIYRATTAIALALAWLVVSHPSVQALPAGNAVTNSNTLLRLALPFDQSNLRDVDNLLATAELDIKRARGNAKGPVQKALKTLDRKQSAILAAVPEANQSQATTDFSQLQSDTTTLSALLEDGDKTGAKQQIDRVLADLSALETDLIDGFPFDIPSEYDGLPRLLGRARVAVDTTAGSMEFTLDGYSAPLTTGNFVDLVQKRFYTDLEFGRVEDSYVVQVGDPPGPADGYVDPKTKQQRTIPLEIRAIDEVTPYYGETFEDAGVWDSSPALPFSAKGTLAMARYAEDLNSASSQFFIFMAEPDLTPAGLNLLDGRYSTFGYVTQGVEVLDAIEAGDRITGIRVLEGADRLQS